MHSSWINCIVELLMNFSIKQNEIEEKTQIKTKIYLEFKQIEWVIEIDVSSIDYNTNQMIRVFSQVV